MVGSRSEDFSRGEFRQLMNVVAYVGKASLVLMRGGSEMRSVGDEERSRH